MDTDSLYSALAHENLYNCIHLLKNKNGKHWDSRTVMTLFKQMLFKISSLEGVALSKRSMINENQGSSRKNSDVRK